jgi:hypothetical protein
MLTISYKTPKEYRDHEVIEDFEVNIAEDGRTVNDLVYAFARVMMLLGYDQKVVQKYIDCEALPMDFDDGNF